MGLKATIPEVRPPRIKALLYANTGAGKTHFCCTLPEVYYIDNEGLNDYPKFIKMLVENGGKMAYINDLSEIIKEIQLLISEKHQYKTVVIDSISFPYGWLMGTETERLIKKNPKKEGTEFGSNLAKAKRLTFQLGILLSRLDMNVFVIAHEKSKIIDEGNSEKTFDISDKLAYSLGTVLNLRLMGKDRKIFVEKSRYDELPNNTFIEFNNGYETLKEKFGESLFIREVISEPLATKEQIIELKQLIRVNKISEERVQSLLNKGKSTCFAELSQAFITKIINKLTPQMEIPE